MAEQMFKASSVDLNFYYNDVKSEKALFLIPGGWGTWRGWSELIEDFNDHAIYAISPPGRGNSGRIGKYDLKTQVDPIIEWIRGINHPNSYILGHSYGALFGCEVAHKIGEQLSGVLLEDPGWTDIFRTMSISEWGPCPELLKAKPKWKTPTDAIEYAKASNPEGWETDPIRTILDAITIYEADINILKGEKGDLVQDYESMCRELKVKTYIARANIEKGGMIDQSAIDTIRYLNNSYIEVHEFDTGHGIREEAKEKYYELVYRMLEA